MTENKKPTLFDFIKQVSNVREKYPYDKKIAPAYMLSMWLSHDERLIDKVNKINKYQFLLPDEIIYKYYRDVVPKTNRYIKWVKKKVDKELKEQVDEMQEEHPELSQKEVKMYIKLKKEIKKNEDKLTKF